DGLYAELVVERLGQLGIVERLVVTLNFVVVASGLVMVGGIRGTSITVDVAPDVTLQNEFGVELWSSADLFLTPWSGVEELLPEGGEARITELMVGSAVVVILQMAPSPSFAAAIAHEKSVVASIRFP
ncbi:MAG TPA: hypothetical protein VEG29_06960, partial [Candidatus Binatia bacterium]|nr:hypothetical protein [Candidatus Binatia bacterium]